MAIGNAMTCQRCKAPVVNNALFCKTCGAPVIQTPAKQTAAPAGSQQPSSPPHAQKPPQRPAKPPAAAYAAGSGHTTLLTCRNCGGQLQYSPGAMVVRCLYCGSDSLVQTPGGSMGGGVRVDDAPPAYYEPKFSATQIRDAIIKKASLTPASLKTLDQISMKIEACYFPAWATYLQVHCNWSGENFEQHTVTKYREERKCVGQRWSESLKRMEDRYEMVSVPYTDTEEIAHPTSGVHDYETTIYLPAAKGVTPEQFALMCRGISGIASTSGIPSSKAGFSVALPTFRGEDAWKTFSGESRLKQDARIACGGFCESINGVGPMVNSRRCSLVWLPMAVASYSVQGQEYRHFASLITGEFWGDIPADYSAVRQEALKVKEEMATLRKQNIAWGLGCLGLAGLCGPGAIYFLVSFLNAPSNSVIPFGWFFLGCSVLALGGLAFGIGMLLEVLTVPWVSFLTNNYAFLARFFLDPPNHLKQRMYEGYAPAELEKVKAGLRDALECNFANDWLRNHEDNNWTRLEAIVTRAADVMVDQPATATPHNLHLYHVPGKGCTTDYSEVSRWREEVAARR